jgi:hypothetical protein
MKASVEHTLVVGELIARTGRVLVVLTLPLVCWLAGQENPAQALLAWAVQRGTALLTTANSAAQAKETVPSAFFCVRFRIRTAEGGDAKICESESYEGIANTIV